MITTWLLLAHVMTAGAPDAGLAAPGPIGRATHVHLAVSDVQRSAAFYREKLGLKQEYLSPEIAIFDLGAYRLMLGPGRLLRPAKIEGVEEGVSLAFAVDDLGAAYETLKARGVRFSRGPKEQRFSSNFFVLDPDGYTLEYEVPKAPGAWTRGIELGKPEGERLEADAFVPAGAGPYPAIIVVHGGGFTGGDRAEHVKPLLDLLATGAWTVLTIDYRLAPKFRYPAPVEDVERAIDYARAHAAELKLDPTRLALLGESAGGYLASLVGARSKGQGRVKAVVALYAAHDQEARARHAGVLAGSTRALYALSAPDAAALKVLRDASPIRYVTAQTPPFLLIHGTADEQVPYEQSTMMCEAMRAAGASCELYTVEGAIHDLNKWEGVPRFMGYKTRIVEWLAAHL